MRLQPASEFIGVKYGLLTIIKDLGKSPKGRSVLCVCECGERYRCRLYSLKRGDTVSCGCYKRLRTTIHGLHGHPLYRHWKAMKVRCYSVNTKYYKNWGGRGITVCDEWKDNFKAFYDWSIANGWKKGLSLDRYPNNNGNYEPSNCRWATQEQQAGNTRVNVWIEYKGVNMIAKQWADKIGIPVSHLLKRLKNGWTLDKAMTSTLYNSKGVPI